ncbi:MAG TPA: hypothetical protein VMC09_02810 [Anaerolineales bacterium]|nr:hypothetical protein [Anaerolineales bacterium]
MIAFTASSTGLSAIFWWLAARRFDADALGLTLVLVSMAQLITTMANFGLNFSVIRFLASSDEKDRFVNTILTFCATAGLILGLLTVLIGPVISRSLGSLQHPIQLGVLFVGLVVLLALFQLSYPVMTAIDKLNLYFYLNIGVLIFRLVLFAIPIMKSDPIRLVLFYTGPLLLADLAIVFVLLPRCIDSYKPRFEFVREIWARIANYSVGSFLGNIFHDLPYQLLPQVVANGAGFANAAYFYFPWNFLGLLVTVSNAISQSLFVEGSSRPATYEKHKDKVRLITLAAALLGAVALFFGGRLILGFFGSEYAKQGSLMLRILCLAALPAAYVYNEVAIMRVRKQVTSIVFIYSLVCMLCIIFNLYIRTASSVIWVCWSWLFIQSVAASVAWILNRSYHPTHEKIA